MQKIIHPLINSQYRANMVAQSICLLINCWLYALTDNSIYIWVAIAAICFIGGITSYPKNRIINHNLLNHLIIVVSYYILGGMIVDFDYVYFILVFLFTYAFFIVKESGYDKSLNLWTYIQCLAFPTTLLEMPIAIKIYSTFIAYLEVQLVLWLSFKVFPSPELYVQEHRIYNFNYIRLLNWFTLKDDKVKLAIRGAVTAGLLYLICVVFVAKDVKPNWAVIAAVSCLLKDNSISSKRTIIGIMFGSIIGFELSWIVIKGNTFYSSFTIFILWITLIIAAICIFEYKRTLSVIPQIIGMTAVMVCFTCMYLVLELNSRFYLDLRLINNIIGLIGASIAYFIWMLYKKYSKYNQ